MNPETRRKAGVWLAMVFVLGLAIGGVFGYNLAHKSYAAGKPPMSEPERRAARVADMTKELGLTSEQSQRLDAVLHQAHDEMKAIREKSEADADAVRQKARSEMRAFLTPEQMPRFEAFVKKVDEERKRQQAQQAPK